LLAIGVPGTTAALALLNDAVKKGGAFASSRVGGLSGAFIPVSEDLNISEAARQGHLCLEKLEAITSVCSVGLDMVAIPETPRRTRFRPSSQMKWRSVSSTVRPPPPGSSRFLGKRPETTLFSAGSWRVRHSFREQRPGKQPLHPPGG